MRNKGLNTRGEEGKHFESVVKSVVATALDHRRAVIIHVTVPSGRFSARKAGGSVKQWDADKLGCVLETSWHSYRQTVVGSWQMLLDCPPARTSPASSSPFFPLSLSPSPSLSFTLRLAITFSSSLSLDAWTTNTLVWKNHESVSLNPILTELERRSRGNGNDSCMSLPSSSGKELLETRERDSTWRSLCVHRGDWSSFLNISWLSAVSFYAFLFSFFFFFYFCFEIFM